MIDFINDAVPYIGLVICTYALLSHRVCTTKRIGVFNFALFIAIYLLLALADFTGFEPVVWTVIGRCMILIVTINIIIENHAAYWRFLWSGKMSVKEIQHSLGVTADGICFCAIFCCRGYQFGYFVYLVLFVDGLLY